MSSTLIFSPYAQATKLVAGGTHCDKPNTNPIILFSPPTCSQVRRYDEDGKVMLLQV